MYYYYYYLSNRIVMSIICNQSFTLSILTCHFYMVRNCNALKGNSKLTSPLCRMGERTNQEHTLSLSFQSSIHTDPTHAQNRIGRKHN